ncbi:MAG: hypothetical protein ACRELY_12550 [Polyangiaceae bacterium]
MRAPCFPVLLVMTLAACDKTVSSAGSAPTIDAAPAASSSATSTNTSADTRTVDALELHTQCLLPGIPTPPSVRSNLWQMVGVLSAGATRYGWIHVDQTNGEVRENDAFAYVTGIPLTLSINKAMNSNHELCTRDWQAALSSTVVTVVVKIAGPDGNGKFAVYGGLAEQDHGTVKILSNVSVTDARRQAIKFASSAVGHDLTIVRDENADWFSGILN